MTRLLLTGAAGFIGSHVARHVLETTDWGVVSLDRLDEAASLSRLGVLKERFGDRLSLVWHDLRAPVRLDALGCESLRLPFDYVAHLAAGSHVDRSIKDPLGFVADNVVGTAHLLEFARANQPGKVLYFSTDEVFGPAQDGVTFDEHSPHTPNNPYAASKAAAEALCPAWANTFNVPIVVTHCTNVFGPGQFQEKFIPSTIRKVLGGQMVQIHAKGGVPSSRYYVHVDNVASAVVTILEKGGIMGGPGTGKFNISGVEEFSNLEVASQIAELLGKQLLFELVDFVPNRPRHDMAYRISGEKLRALGWAPHVSFECGLRATVLGEAKPVSKFP